MRLINVIIILLGSIWFFPVSCTTGVFMGTQIIAKLDEREASKGEEMHSLFSVIIEPGKNGRLFRPIGLSELTEFENNTSFLMSRPTGSEDYEDSNFSYQVIKDTGQEQVIEVVERYHDGDNTIWSRYKATQTSVMPLSSKMLYFGYMFSAVPYSFGFALFLYAFGRFFRRVTKNTSIEASIP